MVDDLPDAPWAQQTQSDLPDAPWATTEQGQPAEQDQRPTAHQRYASVKQQLGFEPSNVAAGFAPTAITPPEIPQEPNPLKNPATVAIGKGLAKGPPAWLSGGVLGDIEGTARAIGKPFGVPQQTFFPQTVEGGYLGPRGLGVMAPPATPQEEGGMLFGSMLTPSVAGKLKDLAGAGAAQTLGLTTGAGPEAFRTAAGAGYEGGEAAQAFRGSMRGTEPMEAAVDDARRALSIMRNERGAAYRSGMADVKNDQTVLNFDKIDKAYEDATNIGTFKGQDIEPAAASMRQDMGKIIANWRELPPDEFHTAEGMDALKKKLGNVYESAPYGSPEAKVGQRIYNAVKQTIVDQAPGYAKIMSGYENASNQLKDIEKTLSLNPNASVDTSLRKLQSTLRDNVNTSYGHRKVLADWLVSAGAPNLMQRLAGQTLQPWAARGLGRLSMQLAAELGLGALGAGYAGIAGIGAAAAGLPFMSPRLMGEAAYYAGRTASPIRYLPEGTGLALGAAPVTAEVGRKAGGRVKQSKFHPASIGARKARDGFHYLPDRKRPGKWLKVIPRG